MKIFLVIGALVLSSNVLALSLTQSQMSIVQGQQAGIQTTASNQDSDYNQRPHIRYVLEGSREAKEALSNSMDNHIAGMTIIVSKDCYRLLVKNGQLDNISHKRS